MTRKCPVCDAVVADDLAECPSCGLPKDLWPDEAELAAAAKEAGPEPLLEAEPPEVAGPAAEVKPLPETPKAAPVVVAEKPASPPAPEPKPVPPPKEEAAPQAPKPVIPEPVREEAPPTPPSRAVEPPPPPKEPPQREALAEPPPAGHVEAPAGVPGNEEATFLELGKVTGNLIGLGIKAQVDVRPAAASLKNAAAAWKVGDPEGAVVLMRQAYEEITHEMETRSYQLLADMESMMEHYGPFVKDSVKQEIQDLGSLRAQGRLEEFYSSRDRLYKEVLQSGKELGVLSQLIETLRTYGNGIYALGGKPFPAKTFVEKAYNNVIKGQRKEAEAILTIGMAQAIEALSPLISQRISAIAVRLKKAHEKGQNVTEVAVVVKQITLALHSRRYGQVLELLEKVDDLIPPDVESKKEESQGSGPRVRARSTIVSNTQTQGQQKSPEPEKKKLEIKKGRSYLIIESRPERSIDALEAAKGTGKALLVTTTFPPKITDDHPLPGVQIVWVSESSGWSETYHPKQLDHEIASSVYNFLKLGSSTVVVLDGVGNLVTANGIDRVEKFLKKIMDLASTKSITVIAATSRGSVDEKILSRLHDLFDYSDSL